MFPRVFVEKSWAESKKKEMMGEGGGEEGNACPQTPRLMRCCAGSVDYLTLETSIKPGMLCLLAPQIWSYLICGRRLQLPWTDLNRVCGKVYEIRVFLV